MSVFSRFPARKINWLTSSFLIFSALTALIGTPLYLYHFGLDVFQVALFVFYVFATGLSITLGYHRLFAHRAFKAKKPVKLFTLIFGACAFENSVLDWASDHRRHHKHVDHEEDDPYSISKGLFWAHMGWLFFKLREDEDFSNVPDLEKDKWVRWQHRWVQLIAVVVGMVLPAILGFLWNGWSGALGAFLLAGVTRVVFVQHGTFCINSLCHSIGSRPYCSNTSARDSGIMALVTFGEGYHNFHHTFQHDYRNGVDKWAYDPTKWTIWLLSKFGLTYDLRRVGQERIVLAQMREARIQAEKLLEQKQDQQPFLCAQREAASRILAEQYRKLLASYTELEHAISERAEVCPKMLARWRRQTQELMDHLAHISLLERSAAFA